MLALVARADLDCVSWLSRHVLALAIIVVALAAAGGVFAFARPAYHPSHSVLKDAPPPYKTVSFKASDASRAFRAEGIVLTPRSHAADITTLGNRHDILEVDIFGDPVQIEKSGFHDLKLGRNCTSSSRLASRWLGNVRVIVNCQAADSGRSWMSRVRRALSRLSPR